MVLEGAAKKLKVIIGETDRVYQRPLFEVIVFAAKKYKMAGVTVTKGMMSYGADSIENNSKVFNLTPEHSIVLEMIDRDERVYDFAEIVRKLMFKARSGGVIAVEDVEVILYQGSRTV